MKIFVFVAVIVLIFIGILVLLQGIPAVAGYAAGGVTTLLALIFGRPVKKPDPVATDQKVKDILNGMAADDQKVKEITDRQKEVDDAQKKLRDEILRGGGPDR